MRIKLVTVGKAFREEYLLHSIFFPITAVTNYHKCNGFINTIQIYSPTILEARSMKSVSLR